MTETNLDESRPNLEFPVLRAGAEEGLGSIPTIPAGHHEAVRGLPDDDVLEGPAVHVSLEIEKVKNSHQRQSRGDQATHLSSPVVDPAQLLTAGAN